MQGPEPGTTAQPAHSSRARAPRCCGGTRRAGCARAVPACSLHSLAAHMPGPCSRQGSREAAGFTKEVAGGWELGSPRVIGAECRTQCPPARAWEGRRALRGGRPAPLSLPACTPRRGMSVPHTQGSRGKETQAPRWKLLAHPQDNQEEGRAPPHLPHAWRPCVCTADATSGGDVTCAARLAHWAASSRVRTLSPQRRRLRARDRSRGENTQAAQGFAGVEPTVGPSRAPSVSDTESVTPANSICL